MENPQMFVLKIIAFFMVLLPSLWVLIFFSLSRIGGWSKMADSYSAPHDLSGPQWERGQTLAFARVSLVPANYTKTARLSCSDDALYISLPPFLSLFHPPLRVPFDDMDVEIKPSKLSDMAIITFKRAPGVKMIVRNREKEALMKRLAS